MPRPKKAGVTPKTRSRTGCWPCKTRKVKCGEERPRCLNCERQGETCDYSIRLNWGGRTKRDSFNANTEPGSSNPNSPHTSVFSFAETRSPLSNGPRSSSFAHHSRSRSTASFSETEPGAIDPDLMRLSQTQPYPFVPGNAHFNHPSPPQEPRTQPTSAPFGILEYPGNGDISSPTPNSFDTSNFNHANYATRPTAPAMGPPTGYPTPNNRQYSDSVDPLVANHQRSYSADSPANSEAYSSPSGQQQGYSPFSTMPLTPNSSVGVDDSAPRTISKPTNTTYPSVDRRRLSVQSLLSGPPGDSSQHSRQASIGYDEYTLYGYDVGLPDLDMPQNDDSNAISMLSPSSGAMNLNGEGQSATEIRGKDMVFEKGGYYAKPVPIKISKSLEPLPSLLLENPMNLLYFHHFLNHTARILVPHDCSQNPFRLILPEMAIHDANILALLLAYSASHRARMLSHAEPSTRIAYWVSDVFPQLRATLLSPSPQTVSNTTLASAIMMASLEIVSPNTFDPRGAISWRAHLNMARSMIIARGGPRSFSKADRAAYFLSRWFAYLDVLGSLSGAKNDTPLGSWYWSSEHASSSPDEDFHIDCLTGFTNRCVGLLAGVAELAKETEPLRIDATGSIRRDFVPGPQVLERAERIRRELVKGLTGATEAHKGCTHRSSPTSTSSPSDAEALETTWDATEIYATNEMFHWAGLIHLYRRVYNYAAEHPSVQQCVREIVGLLYKVRRGSTAETCLLFPMFAAGCDALDQGVREKVLERLAAVEGCGMGQVGRARGIMEEVWRTGRAWEGVVEGEFFG